MPVTAKLQNYSHEAHCLRATVRRADAQRLSVGLDDGSVAEASCAVSCLVDPRANDTVLVCWVAASARYYVLAVLERADDAAPLPIVAPAGIEVETPQGFSVQAERVSIAARGKAELSASEVGLGAARIQLVFRELAALGHEIVARADKLQAIVRYASGRFERMHTRAERSYKVVSELEHVSAKQLNYQVSGSFSLHSRNGMVTTEELLKLDGKLVQLG